MKRVNKMFVFLISARTGPCDAELIIKLMDFIKYICPWSMVNGQKIPSLIETQSKYHSQGFPKQSISRSMSLIDGQTSISMRENPINKIHLQFGPYFQSFKLPPKNSSSFNLNLYHKITNHTSKNAFSVYISNPSISN